MIATNLFIVAIVLSINCILGDDLFNSQLQLCQNKCKSSGLTEKNLEYCKKQCIAKVKKANEPRADINEISTGLFNISWNGPTFSSTNRWKYPNLTYHIYIRSVSGKQFNEQDATGWIKTATNTTNWMTAGGARPGIWYQFNITATIYEARKTIKIWEAISQPAMTRVVGNPPSKPTKISARQHCKANNTVTNVEVSFARPKTSDYQIIYYRLRLRCLPRIYEVNKMFMFKEHRKKINAKWSSDRYHVLFKRLPINSLCQIKIQAVAAWGNKIFKSKFTKFCVFLWPPGERLTEKIRLHNLCHTKTVATSPRILASPIYPTEINIYSLSLTWLAPVSSERIHIFAYHIQWTVVPFLSLAANYTKSVFVESHDITLRRHIQDEDDYFYIIGELPPAADVYVKIFPLAYSGLGKFAEVNVTINAETISNIRTRAIPDITSKYNTYISTHFENVGEQTSGSTSAVSQPVPFLASLGIFLSICFISICFGEATTWKRSISHIFKHYMKKLSKSEATCV